MANNLASFANIIQTLSENVVRNATAMQKDVAMHVLDEVARATPVDTGRAISNWLVNPDSPANFTLYEAHTPGQLGSTQSVNIQQTINDGDDVIKSHVKGPLHITNNLDYVLAMNEGRQQTRQATPHFVEAAVLSASKVGITRSILDSSPGASIR